MQIRRTLYALLALAIAFAFSPITQAASPMGPGSQPGTENLTYTVKAKAKAKKAPAKKAKAKGKKAKSKGPGRCGTSMYFKKASARARQQVK